MNRREFYRNSSLLGLGLMTDSKLNASNQSETGDPELYEE